MVSGFLTSPWDHWRMSSAVARPMRSSSKKLTSSTLVPLSLVAVAHLDRDAVAGEDLDVQAERLHLLDEHLEGLGDAGLGDVLALDDGLVDLHAAGDVVGLDGQQLLEGVCGAVC